MNCHKSSFAQPVFVMISAATILASGARLSQAGQTELGTAPPTAFCATLEKVDHLRVEANDKFAEDGSDGKWEQRKEWISKRESKLMKKLAVELGSTEDDLYHLSYQYDWQRSCDASDRGWVQIRKADLMDVADDQVDKARDAVTLEYRLRLERAPDAYFDPERYGGVHCDDVTVDGFHFLGCFMRALSAESGRDIYLIAQVAGKPVLVPYADVPEARMKGRVTMSDGEEAVQLGSYVDKLPLVDYGSLLAAFE